MDGEERSTLSFTAQHATWLVLPRLLYPNQEVTLYALMPLGRSAPSQYAQAASSTRFADL